MENIKQFEQVKISNDYKQSIRLDLVDIDKLNRFLIKFFNVFTIDITTCDNKKHTVNCFNLLSESILRNHDGIAEMKIVATQSAGNERLYIRFMNRHTQNYSLIYSGSLNTTYDATMISTYMSQLATKNMVDSNLTCFFGLILASAALTNISFLLKASFPSQLFNGWLIPILYALALFSIFALFYKKCNTYINKYSPKIQFWLNDDMKAKYKKAILLKKSAFVFIMILSCVIAIL